MLPTLSVKGLTVARKNKNAADLVLVDDVSFDLWNGQVTALVGESGSGKTVTSMSLLGLSQDRGTDVVGGDALLKDRSVLGLNRRDQQKIRGREISAIFQDPLNSLDPMYTIGNAIVEVVRTHQKTDRETAWQLGVSALEKAGIPDPEERMRNYPFELSGGLLQRVMIALAIVLSPQVIVADEPTTALDVVTQARVMTLLRRLAREGRSVLFVTHDLGLVREYADYVNIMYAGQIVESGPTDIVLASPRHPYTSQLIAASPTIDHRLDRLATIPGTVPQPSNYPAGCRFANRCAFATDGCESPQELVRIADAVSVRCHRSDELFPAEAARIASNEYQ